MAKLKFPVLPFDTDGPGVCKKCLGSSGWLGPKYTVEEDIDREFLYWVCKGCLHTVRMYCADAAEED